MISENYDLAKKLANKALSVAGLDIVSSSVALRFLCRAELINKNYDYDKFPYRSKLLTGTAANLLFIAANRFRRNSLQYSAGGMTVADQEKHQLYDAAGSRLWEDYKAWVVFNKRSLNAEMGWASI
jgi:hypothetical protein